MNIPDENVGLLYRIDERTKALTITVDDIKENLQRSYVRQEEFTPVRRIVFGLVTLILAAVGAGLMGVLLK